MSEAEKAVTRRDDGAGWDFVCPRRTPDGVAMLCGPQGEDHPFVSDRWPTKKSAVARGEEHLREHDAGEEMLAARRRGEITPQEHDEKLQAARMSELHVFREKHGLYVDAEGIARVKDEGPK